MRLRLNEDYQLRGWKGANCALLHRSTKQVTIVKPGNFRLLLLADGCTDLDSLSLSETEWDTVRGFVDKGFCTLCEEASPIREDQQYRRYDNRYIRSVLWSVTGRCNFRCRHCYMDAPNGQLGELSHAEAMDIIDQIADCGILDIALTGGEVFVRSDIRELITHITERGIRISQIYTNGWLVDASILDFLDSLGQKPEFNISFDGIGWHDWLRRVNGCEERVLDALRLCQSRGFPTGIEACLHRDSVASLRETVKLMGSLNTRLKVGTIMETELWKQYGEGKTLPIDEYVEAMLAYIPQFFEDGMPADLTLGSVIHLHKGSREFRVIAEKRDGTEKCLDQHMCGAARMAAYIAPDGRVLPCMPMTAWPGHTVFPKLQDIGLKQCLTDGFYMNFVNGRIRELFEKNPKCGTCEYRLRCGGGCRACALTSENDLYGRDLDQCRFWKKGYVDRIRQTAEAAIEKYCHE